MIYSQNWNAFYQRVPVSSSWCCFRFSIKVSVHPRSPVSSARIWVRLENNQRAILFLDNQYNHPIRTETWSTYTIAYKLKKGSKWMYFGAIYESNGEFWFAEAELHVKNHKNCWTSVPIMNSQFKKINTEFQSAGWYQGTGYEASRSIQEYSVATTFNKKLGKECLKIIGYTELDEYESIRNSYSPFIAEFLCSLQGVTLKLRRTIQDLKGNYITFKVSQKPTIAQLLMHLIATEDYYITTNLETQTEFSAYKDYLNLSSEFSDEEQDRNIKFYLEELQKIRLYTLKLFLEKKDSWLLQKVEQSSYTNHYVWTHVLEHYSYHTAQIIYLKKEIDSMFIE